MDTSNTYLTTDSLAFPYKTLAANEDSTVRPEPQKKDLKQEYTENHQKDTPHSFNPIIPPARIFTQQHSIPVNSATLNKRNYTVTQWEMALLLGIISLLGFIKAFNATRTKQIFSAFFSFRVTVETMREEKVLTHRVNLILGLVFLLTTALVILKTNLFFASITALNYLKILIAIFLVYLIKFTCSHFLAFIFNYRNLGADYIFNVLLYNYLFGILALPLIIVWYFTAVDSHFMLSYAIIPLTVGVLLLRFNRLSIMGISNNISYLHIILYICTLEILPLVVLWKVFIFK